MFSRLKYVTKVKQIKYYVVITPNIKIKTVHSLRNFKLLIFISVHLEKIQTLIKNLQKKNYLGLKLILDKTC